MNKLVSIIVASPCQNLNLAKEFEKAFNKKDLNTNLLLLTDYDIPLYTPKNAELGIPDDIISMLPKLIKSEGMIFVAPEYNGAAPPSLTNFITWVSLAAEDWRSVFNSKIAAIATHSGGPGLHVLAAMRQQLSYIGMTVIGRQINTSKNKPLNNESLDDVVNQFTSYL